MPDTQCIPTGVKLLKIRCPLLAAPCREHKKCARFEKGWFGGIGFGGIGFGGGGPIPGLTQGNYSRQAMKTEEIYI